jgi:hypothetical protein
MVGGVAGVLTKDEHGAGANDACQVVGGIGPVCRAVEPPEETDARWHLEGTLHDVGPLRHVDGLAERDALCEFDGLFQACDRCRRSAGIQIVSKGRRRKEDGTGEIAIDAISVGITVVARIVRFPDGSRASEEPEEAGLTVQRQRHPIGGARPSWCLRHRPPDRGFGVWAGDLDPESKVGPRPAEFDAALSGERLDRGLNGQSCVAGQKGENGEQLRSNTRDGMGHGK